MKKLLTIAGSDSSGGAGIQADLKTFAALGTYGMSVIVALTAQNTQGVSMVANTSSEMVEAQLKAVYDDIPPDGVKTGMLSTPGIVHTVAEFLKKHGNSPLVVDPVMVATTGAVLLEKEAIESYKKELFPLATVITPNIPEAEVLSGIEIKTVEDMEEAASRLMKYGMKSVVVKGGHRVNDALDVLYDGKEFYRFQGKRIETKNTHGTGCTLSSALAVMLSKGMKTSDAVVAAKELFPLATVITPNIPEAEVLSGIEIKTVEDMEEAASRLMKYGMKSVVVKGGHRVNDALDVLYDGKEFYRFQGKRIETKNTHGTGCTLSSALAVMLSKGMKTSDAVVAAKEYLTGALDEGKNMGIGHGSGPVHHFWFYKERWGDL